MLRIKVGAGALNQTPLNWERNLQNIKTALDQARKAEIGILCLPELCITGYGCEDAFLSPGVLETAWELLEELVPASKGLVTCVGLPILYQHAVFNSSCLLADGRILGFVAKKFLCGDGVHYEPRWFKPWPVGIRTQLKRGQREYPLGDCFFDISGIKVGFEICEDAWVAERPGNDLSLHAVDIILNPSASHFAFGKHEIRRRFTLEGSRAFNVSYVYANLLGCEAGRLIFDGDCLIASQGELLAVGERFSFKDVYLCEAIIDLDRTRMAQAQITSFTPVLKSDENCIECSSFAIKSPTDSAEQHPAPTDSWNQELALKEREFTRAVSLGLYDYLRKSRSSGFVVSLSGGADSSAVSCLVALMLKLAIKELGIKQLVAEFSYSQRLTRAEDESDLINKLLTCVYQRTKNNSETTRTAARELAKALGAEFFEFEIDTLIAQYTSMVSSALGYELDWERDDAALQNVQARVRSPGVWLIANHQSKLLLCTSNRSEAAVGYATMDGDTSGGLNPIGGIDKDFLRRWLRWLETSGLESIGPIPILRLVNQQEPTAELRPLETKQTDERDLMPYEALERIEELAIGERKMPLEVFTLLWPRYRESIDVTTLAGWIEKFFRLWCANQWKRERYAPSFHLDDKNLDPKTWCRFPILSGGYRREIELLRAHIRSITQKV